MPNWKAKQYQIAAAADDNGEEMIAAEEARRAAKTQNRCHCKRNRQVRSHRLRAGVEGLIGAPADLVTWETRKAASLPNGLGLRRKLSRRSGTMARADARPRHGNDAGCAGCD